MGHTDGNRYLVVKKNFNVLLVGCPVDLPVYKLLRNRVGGTSALCGNAQTFDHKDAPLDARIPAYDARRHVSDGIVLKYAEAAQRLKPRNKIGSTLLKGSFRTISGLQPRIPIMHPVPTAVVDMIPEYVHAFLQNFTVTTNKIIKEKLKKIDKNLVRVAQGLACGKPSTILLLRRR